MLDHMADVVIQAHGECLEDVFAQMSEGMWFLMFEGAKIPNVCKWAIEVQGMDPEELLVNFLNEQIGFLEVEGLVVSQIEQIEIKKANGEFCLKSDVSGCHLSDLDVSPVIHVKAATFHELEVNPNYARVTFDV
ncbi:MAG TPA: archease [Bacillota bacterium]|nr:archease [Bacillota bacterium]HOK64941.1 archease [Bacillota bacterium]HOL12500.1 archease [Bacillota bacterium]HOQ03288.1 archease [Bacillota bacterium]HPP61409.1 archease [Bacillota bacterium]